MDNGMIKLCVPTDALCAVNVGQPCKFISHWSPTDYDSGNMYEMRECLYCGKFHERTKIGPELFSTVHVHKDSLHKYTKLGATVIG